MADNIAIHSTDAGGWLTVSGTTASAPFIAGIYGVAGHASTAKPADFYQPAGSFVDITTGNNDPALNGVKRGNDYLCVAQVGYDAPTGVGTPNGLAGF